KQLEMDTPGTTIDRDVDGDFKFRAGCTILIAPETQEIRRVIRTSGTVANDMELERVRRFLTGENGVSGNAFDAGLAISLASLAETGSRVRNEPFALLHEHEGNKP
ncbi:MAG: hypothetical protein ABL921_35540, partial [Pirellula sp.]